MKLASLLNPGSLLLGLFAVLAVGSNVSAILHSFQWLIVVGGCFGVLIADRLYLSRSNTTNFSFRWNDKSSWVTFFAMFTVVGMTGSYMFKMYIQ